MKRLTVVIAVLFAAGCASTSEKSCNPMKEDCTIGKPKPSDVMKPFPKWTDGKQQ